jgi:hypothetical protein
VANEELGGSENGNGRGGGGQPDRLGIVNVGLRIKSMGEALAETGRLLGQVAPGQSAAELAALDSVIADIIGTLEAIRIGARAEVRRFLGGG